MCFITLGSIDDHLLTRVLLGTRLSGLLLGFTSRFLLKNLVFFSSYRCSVRSFWATGRVSSAAVISGRLGAKLLACSGREVRGQALSLSLSMAVYRQDLCVGISDGSHKEDWW